MNPIAPVLILTILGLSSESSEVADRTEEKPMPANNILYDLLTTCRLVYRKTNIHSRAFSYAALDGNVTGVALDDVAHNS